MLIVVFCSGGAELLFDKVKEHDVVLPKDQDPCEYFSLHSSFIKFPVILVLRIWHHIITCASDDDRVYFHHPGFFSFCQTISFLILQARVYLTPRKMNNNKKITFLKFKLLFP